MNLALLLLLATLGGAVLPAGDHTRSLSVQDQPRTYLVHVPKSLDPQQPAPVVLALHGAAMNGPMMVGFCGLNETADREGFIVVYPSGTGRGPFLTWNAGAFGGRSGLRRADDVAFIRSLLDDLASATRVDPKRVYACGMSNGAMMCYRLAAELSDRIAAIAPVAGTVAIDESKPTRPVPVLHFHGTEDKLVPFEFSPERRRPLAKLKDVPESVALWIKLNGCTRPAVTETLSKAGDELRITRTIYGGGHEGAEVVLVKIEGGGHTWPGQRPPIGLIGLSATNLCANDLIWEFFKKHPLR